MAEGLVRGIRAIDCGMHPRWPGLELGPHHASRPGPLLVRDPESRGQFHPDEHIFKGAGERAARGDTPESTIAMMDALGVLSFLGFNWE